MDGGVQQFLFFGDLPGGRRALITASYNRDEEIPGCLVIAIYKSIKHGFYPKMQSITGDGTSHLQFVAVDKSLTNVIASHQWYLLEDDEVIASGTLRERWSYFKPLLKNNFEPMLLGLVLQAKEK